MDFLDFDIFVSMDILKVLYFTGALVLPVFMWMFLQKTHRKFPALASFPFSDDDTVGGRRSRLLRWMFFALFFIGAEVLWRIVFEYLIAYLQIREILMELFRYNTAF